MLAMKKRVTEPKAQPRLADTERRSAFVQVEDAAQDAPALGSRSPSSPVAGSTAAATAAADSLPANMREASSGTRVIETTSEEIKLKLTVRERSVKIWAAKPSMKITGIKTATVVRVDAGTAAPTSRVP